MSREIKFRAWDKANKHMWPVASLHWTRKQVMYHNPPALGGPVVAWNECTLMQYTGLKDKNGKEIYEGDIVKVTFDDEESIHAVEYLAEKFDYPAFDLMPGIGADANGLSWATCADDHELEVIGNIYQNGDLLK